MDFLKNKTFGIVAALVLLMAATRYNHFGSAMTLPDASYAVFFLGGLFLGRMRGALAIMALLLVEAALVDYYAINFRDMSGWCVTSAYAFLVFAYAALWFVGRWYAPRHELTLKGMSGLLLAGAAAGSAAFIIANVSFYLLAGYFDRMSVVQYVFSVGQYFGPYVAVTVFYVAMAVGIQMYFDLVVGKARAANAR
ncbi:MAG: hypothetical protein KJ850_04480 [Gammaproteobacteria bacterium]|nr:hypothetical protein [Gammaproteobacteria bacterium]MBU1624287.1 hypothetical protein [Gammaproteobacteria bacterium]MBU1981015.1 hypothetical protein [Gammaproteobacteria bacterium]